jgi:transglutaminase-like putative cysteine protease
MMGILHLRLLLLSLVLVLALHAPWQTPWVLLVIALLFAWRYRIAVKQKPLPGGLLLLPIAVLGAAGVFFTYGSLAGRDSGVALFSLLLALKLMEARSARDFTLIVHLGYFLTICTFLFSQSMTMALLVTLPTLALTSTLVAINHSALSTLDVREHVAKPAMMLLGLAIPLLLALFVLFPRAPGPMWGMPRDATRAMTGLDDEMSPGKISNLSKSYEVAFRVAFRGKPPPQTQLYWRGPVLWSFDGLTWRGGSRQRSPGLPEMEANSAPLEYTVTLEPHNRPWLFLLDLPVRPPQTGQTTTAFSTDFELLALQAVRQRIRYDAASSTDFRYGDTLSPSERERALQLPFTGEPRTRELAKQWAAANPDPQVIAQRALDLFRNNFAYTLLAPPLGGNPVDEFLFTTRKGFCEHFAGSFVYLMRAAGVPARVVTGYQGGEFNKLGDYMIVRQTDAHAWAEIWVAGKGWVRVDPTAAVMPARVASGIASALPENEPLPGLARPELTPTKRLDLGWDAVNNSYNQWILGYNQKRQTELLSRITGSKVSKADLVVWLLGFLLAIIGGIAFVLLRPSTQHLDEPQRLWLKFQRKLASAGLERQPAEGPLDFAVRAAQAFPASQAKIGSIIELYLPLRYGGSHNPAHLAALEQHVNSFKIR